MVSAGVFIAIQSSMSAQLAKLLGSPSLATWFLYCASFLVMTLFVFFSGVKFPTFNELRSIPAHLWFLGSLFSAMALSLVYYQMPKVGVARAMSGVICGQLIFSIVASHFGWFSLPVNPIDLRRVLGGISLLLGVVLINK